MVHQEVHGKRTGPLEGILLIAGIVLGLLLLTVINNLLLQWIWTPVFPALLYLCAIAAALWLLRTRVREFHYTVNGGILYLERVYGARTHILLQIPLSDILLLGGQDEVGEKYPKARTVLNATTPQCSLPVRVAAFRRDGSVQLVKMQPNPEMAAAIYDPEERARRAREKWG